MADKRPYGSGEIIDLGGGHLAIRWRERFRDSNNKIRTRKKFKTLGAVSRKQAAKELNDRISVLETEPTTRAVAPMVTFKEHAERWRRDILPAYKPSVRLIRGGTPKKSGETGGGMIDVHLIPRFGDRPVTEITTIDIQEWITSLRERGYAPHSIDDYHGCLSAILNSAVTWYGLPRNPAHGVRIGKVRPLAKKWALSFTQAQELLGALQLKPRVMVALDLVTGLRRGELEALRWEDLNEKGELRVDEHHYCGFLDDPKTEAGRRTLPVPAEVLSLIREWKTKTARTKPTDYIFATRHGTPIIGNLILRRHVYPACVAIGIPRASWLTFRRTFKRWCDDLGMSPKDIAEMMGHADVETQQIYAVGMDEQKRIGADRLGKQLGNIGQNPTVENELVN